MPSIVKAELLMPKISRQREWQLRQMAKGMCIYCPEKAEGGSTMCGMHRRKTNARRRARAVVKRRYTQLEDWLKVDWSLPTETIAAQMGVKPQTVLWRKRSMEIPA